MHVEWNFASMMSQNMWLIPRVLAVNNFHTWKRVCVCGGGGGGGGGLRGVSLFTCLCISVMDRGLYDTVWF